MARSELDNGEYFMRRYGRDMVEAQRLAQRQAINQYNRPLSLPYFGAPPRAARIPLTPGERPEPEDTTGLKMLEEFLARMRPSTRRLRTRERRDGDERK